MIIIIIFIIILLFFLFSSRSVQIFHANPLMPRLAGRILWEQRLQEKHDRKGKYAPKKGPKEATTKGKKKK